MIYDSNDLLKNENVKFGNVISWKLFYSDINFQQIFLIGHRDRCLIFLLTFSESVNPLNASVALI